MTVMREIGKSHGDEGLHSQTSDGNSLILIRIIIALPQGGSRVETGARRAIRRLGHQVRYPKVDSTDAHHATMI
jgi:hypothetical protein